VLTYEQTTTIGIKRLQFRVLHGSWTLFFFFCRVHDPKEQIRNAWQYSPPCHFRLSRLGISSVRTSSNISNNKCHDTSVYQGIPLVNLTGCEIRSVLLGLIMVGWWRVERYNKFIVLLDTAASPTLCLLGVDDCWLLVAVDGCTPRMAMVANVARQRRDLRATPRLSTLPRGWQKKWQFYGKQDNQQHASCSCSQSLSFLFI